MKLFDPRAELAKIQNQRGTPSNPANPANLEAQTPCKLAGLAAPPPEIPKTQGLAKSASPAPDRPPAAPVGHTATRGALFDGYADKDVIR